MKNLLVTALFIFLATPALADRPNIVLFIADDIGYHELGSFGGPATPNIDAIAGAGLTFTDFYATPFCTPTRADVQTGRYHQRTGLNSALGYLSSTGLPFSEVTMAEQLRTNGYATALVGKWHLGRQDAFHPNRQGYDYFFGFRGGEGDYFTHRTNYGSAYIDWWRNSTFLPTVEYSTWAYTREANAFVNRTTQPFFMVISYQAVHTPIQSPSDTDGGNHLEHRRETIAAMDASIGDITRKLPPNTVVFFMSDNGGSPLDGGSNFPLRGGKGSVYEGGVRVPMIVKGPGVVRGTRTTVLAAIDLFPTIMRLTGTSLPAVRLDGVDFSPVLRGTGGIPARRLFWTQHANWAVRSGRWKLDCVNGALGLYDLRVDIGERRNLAGARPDVVSRLHTAFDVWKADVTRGHPLSTSCASQ